MAGGAYGDCSQHRAFLHARLPRVKGPACGVKQVEGPYVRQERGLIPIYCASQELRALAGKARK